HRVHLSSGDQHLLDVVDQRTEVAEGTALLQPDLRGQVARRETGVLDVAVQHVNRAAQAIAVIEQKQDGLFDVVARRAGLAVFAARQRPVEQLSGPGVAVRPAPGLRTFERLYRGEAGFATAPALHKALERLEGMETVRLF